MKNELSIFKRSAFLVIALISFSCSVNRGVKFSLKNENITIESKTELGDDELSVVSGRVIDIDGNPIPGVKITIQNGDFKTVQISDKDGNFQVTNLKQGVYELVIQGETEGFESISAPMEIKSPANIHLLIKPKRIQMLLEKPIIYLYPEQKQKVCVKLDYAGELEYTYPKYPENGWEITAEPNGTLWDIKGTEYYALFWEGRPNQEIIARDGFVVAGSKTTEFLEEKLAYLGLNRKEANEFIVYWLPRMEKNKYNLIHFSSSEYEAIAALKIVPKPQTLIRVMMLTSPLEEKIDFPSQDLKPLKKERKGFTVVEWGGSSIKLPNT